MTPSNLQDLQQPSTPKISTRVDRTALEIVHRYEHLEPITNHPFLLHLAAEPINLNHLWLFFANFQIAISNRFAQQLAGIVARVDDERVRCILAEQLNDEMGRGKFDDAHINLFARMMKQLEPWQLHRSDEVIYSPGRNLEPRLAELYGSADVREAVGANMVGEIFARQVWNFLSGQFRRQNQLDAASLEWLVVHDSLEVSHADSSTTLAQLVTADDFEPVARGGQQLRDLGWAFLDDLDAVCYGAVDA